MARKIVVVPNRKVPTNFKIQVISNDGVKDRLFNNNCHFTLGKM